MKRVYVLCVLLITVRTSLAQIPNDPYYLSHQKTYFDVVKMDSAWMVTKGNSNQKIAFLAHGMPWLNHPELKVGTTPKVFIRNNGTMYTLRASAMTSTV